MIWNLGRVLVALAWAWAGAGVLPTGAGAQTAGAPPDPGRACPLHRSLSPARAACDATGPGTPWGAPGPVGAWEALATAPDRPVLLPVRLGAYARSAYPMDRDNGAVWAGKGASGSLEFGAAGRVGPVAWALYPSVAWSSNGAFAQADTVVPGFSPDVYPWERIRIDVPQRFGTGALTRWTPGQSYVELDGPGPMTLGVSTENLWWGPSDRYPLLFGATAEGFPHAYVESGDVDVGPGTVRVTALVGRVRESGHFDFDPENNRQLVEAFRVEIVPARTLGLSLAATSVVRQRWDDALGVGDLLEVFPTSSNQDRRAMQAVDALGAVEASWRMGAVALTGTWGRGDFFANTEDLLSEPDHNQFWTVGLRHLWTGPDGRAWTFATEYASTAAETTQFGPRGDISPAVYRHSGLRQGHTHRGQLLGASIGPGSRAGYARVARTGDDLDLSLLVERVEWDIDTHKRTLRATYGPDSRDTEYLAGVGFRLSGPRMPFEGVTVRGMVGGSVRANRQYVRFTGENRSLPTWETNLWLDLVLAWRP